MYKKNNLNIMIDSSIPYGKEFFSCFGNVELFTSDFISLKKIKKTDALIVRSITKVNEDLLKDSKISFIGTVTSGIDHIDRKYLEKNGICFSSSPGCNSVTVVEYVISALLYLSQNNNFYLKDKIIGIVGVGNIGSLLNNILKILDIKTILCDPYLTKFKLPGDWKTFEELVIESDIITFHTPLTFNKSHATWHMINDDFLSSLPSGRTIINTSRGGIIDNHALLKALKQGKNINLILDVWEFEPKILFSLLPYIDIATPHIAGSSIESKLRSIIQIFNCYKTFVGNDNVSNININDFIPKPNIERVKLNNVKFNEDILRKLINLIYDIKTDDIKLRQIKNYPWKFNFLRETHYSRREWSSLTIEINDESTAYILQKLGFKIIK